MPTAFTAKLLEKDQLTHDVVKLSFSCPEFSFKAGQFVIVKIEGKPRSYSILNPPQQKNQLDLCVKIVPGGLASGVFNQTELGTEFEMRGPFGHFVFEPSQEMWFLATGTGVAPFYSMIRGHVHEFPGHTFHLVFSVKNEKDLFLHKEFLQLEKKQKNFTYLPTLTRDSWEGLTGRVQTHLPKNVKNIMFYICGVKEFVLETKEFLLGNGVSKDMIRVERYT
jgi:ferredoxin-NADP reductase